ncbi:unnamed protein product [Nyctereutes procyonoides]|uniref:(raccoon dog) hypothetical protein n=1 Tax=Nyctereutes procyonoides TaxID=34880 RepID=A0A811XXW1_NYCPR|nr:unnamed protein product [Nyctereutes procyonoides]
MPAAPAPQPLAGGVGAQRRGEGGAGGRASRGRARRAPGGGGPGPGAAGLRPERGRTPTRRDAREGRGECCLGGSRGEAAAGAARRARPPPAPEVCKGTDSRPGSPRLPHSALGREECRPVDAALPAASQAGRGRGASGLEGRAASGGSSKAPRRPGAPKGAPLPGPLALCRDSYAPLLCPSLALPPPLSLRHPFPHPRRLWLLVPAGFQPLQPRHPSPGQGAAHICASTPRGRGGREGPLAEALWAQPVTQEDGQGSLAVLPPRGMLPASGKVGAGPHRPWPPWVPTYLRQERGFFLPWPGLAVRSPCQNPSRLLQAQ